MGLPRPQRQGTSLSPPCIVPMVETTTTSTSTARESRLGVRRRHATPADAAMSRTSGAPFWALAFFLVLGIGIALVLALRGYNGPGVLTPEEAFTATGMALLTVAIVLLVFLGTIGYVFGQVRRLRSLGEERESRRIEDTARQEAATRQLRDEVAALRQREHLLVQELSSRRAFAKGAREGDPHIIELQGIGPLYATRLNRLGIITVNQLVQAEPVALAKHIEATPEQVREWQAMGRLLQVKGVGPQWAEALARVGVTSPQDLAGRDAGEVAGAIAKLNASGTRVTGTDPPAATVAKWIANAGKVGQAPSAARAALEPAGDAPSTRRVTRRKTARPERRRMAKASAKR